MNCPGEKADLEIPPVSTEGAQAHWVICRGYRCLAMHTKDRKWICFATGKELTDIVEVVYE